MAKTNMQESRVKPTTAQLVTLEVQRRSRVSPSIERVTLGGGDAEHFVPMGYDQWFRLFIPAPGGTLDRVPSKLDTLSYLRFLTISKSVRPVIRNYTVRAHRPDGATGPEIDVDVVLHGSVDDGQAGPASTWAQTCTPGDPVALLDEGTMFRLPDSVSRVLLVADETGLPAVAGILGSLPEHVRGHAVVEVPDDADRQVVDGPAGVEVTWLSRSSSTGATPAGTPGRLALEHARALPLPDEPVYAWAVGEQGLASELRRHWVASGVPKDRVMFCGYWKAKH